MLLCNANKEGGTSVWFDPLPPPYQTKGIDFALFKETVQRDHLPMLQASEVMLELSAGFLVPGAPVAGGINYGPNLFSKAGMKYLGKSAKEIFKKLGRGAPIAEDAAEIGLKPLGLGSTGRTVANNLVEEMAMKDAMANPQLGTVIMEGMKDSRWLNWTKMEYKIKTANGTNAIVHYVAKWENGVLKAIDDFKFK